MKPRFLIPFAAVLVLVVSFTTTVDAQRYRPPVFKPAYKPPVFKMPEYRPPVFKMPEYKLPEYKLPEYKLPGESFRSHLDLNRLTEAERIKNLSLTQLELYYRNKYETPGFQANDYLQDSYALRLEQARKDRERFAFKTQLIRDPVSGLKALSNSDLWTVAEKLDLANAAITRLEHDTNEFGLPLSSLRKVREIAGVVRWDENLSSLGSKLRALETRLEKDCLSGGLQSVTNLAEKGQWANVAQVAKHYLPSLLTANKGRDTLVALEALAHKMYVLEQVQTALQKPAAAKALAEVDSANLPDHLKKSIQGLRSALALEKVVKADRPVFQDASEVVTQLRDSTGNNALAGRALRDLATRAFLEGDPARARELLAQEEALGLGQANPGDTPNEAAALLRDMKALILSEGTVRTEPAQRAVTLRPDEGGAGNKGPPPGINFLLPEGDRTSWRPPVVDSALQGLPPLENVVSAQVETLRQTAEAQFNTEMQTAQEAKTVLLTQARRFTPKTQVVFHGRPTVNSNATNQLVANAQSDDEEKAAIVAVETLLGRSLTTLERAEVRRLRSQNWSATQIAALLKGKIKEKQSDPPVFQRSF